MSTLDFRPAVLEILARRGDAGKTITLNFGAVTPVIANISAQVRVRPDDGTALKSWSVIAGQDAFHAVIVLNFDDLEGDYVWDCEWEGRTICGGPLTVDPDVTR